MKRSQPEGKSTTSLCCFVWFQLGQGSFHQRRSRAFFCEFHELGGSSKSMKTSGGNGQAAGSARFAKNGPITFQSKTIPSWSRSSAARSRRSPLDAP